MHDLDMQQVFAEVYYFYLQGQIWWLDKEEEKLVDESNRQFMLVQPIEEQILEVFDISLPRTRKDWL
jgi:predicted P-loop ATPase